MGVIMTGAIVTGVILSPPAPGSGAVPRIWDLDQNGGGIYIYLFYQW